MNKIHSIRKFLWKLGYDLHSFEPIQSPVARKKILFKNYKIDLIIDIGANIGHFVDAMKADLDYSGKIISFEPTSSAFKILSENSKNDLNWEVFNCAIGAESGNIEINVSENSESSSILEITDEHLNAAPNSKYISKEKVEVKTIDELFPKLFSPFKNIFMKIDTQGFEKNIIYGAKNSLDKISTIQLEMSISPLYKNEASFREMYDLMISFGYKMVSIETGYLNQKGEMLQLDAIFHHD